MADKTDYLKNLIKLQNEYNKQIESTFDIDAKVRIHEDAITNQKKIQLEYEQLIATSKKDSLELTAEEEKQLGDILDEQEKINNAVEQEKTNRQLVSNLLNNITNSLKKGITYLLTQDKIIKTTSLTLGLSGSKAELMRLSFEQSASAAAMLSASIEDIGAIQTGFAEETGRARALTADMVMDIVAIGKGTGLGIADATKLAAQFEIMGLDARKTNEFVQGVVDTTERMGVNTSKVLKNINNNFRRINTYTFQQGVKGISQMAAHAEKFKIDISEALNAADVARSLEGAIDLAANLQVMGGEFAKTDPFEMLFLSRNDPAKFTEKIGDMTKGIVSFRKMADGSFEKFISPADRDRIANVAKSLNMSVEQVTEMAQRQAEIQRMRQQMSGMGLSKEQQELLEGAAIFDSKSGKFQVQIAGHMKDVANLNEKQLSKFKEERVLLKDRAEQAQTFDEVFLNTINALKASLLPLLEHVNGFLEDVRPIAEGFGKQGLGGSAAILLSAGLLWKGVAGTLRGVGGGLTNIISKKVGGAAAGGGAAKGAGKGMMRGGLGVGAAALGIGAGIGLAATGISKLADSMSKLDETQINELPNVIMSLGVAFIPFAAALIAVGIAGKLSAVGLLAVGGAVALIGAGIGAAAWGIGEMGKGLAELVTAGAEAGDSMFNLASGMAMMAGSLLLFTAGGLGMIVFGNTLRMIAKRADDIERVGVAFGNINAVLSGNKEDWIAIQNAVESISKANVSGGGMLAELATLLKSPLKVEFSDNKVALTNDITLNIDGQKLMNKTYDVNVAIAKAVSAQAGKSSNKE